MMMPGPQWFTVTVLGLEIFGLMLVLYLFMKKRMNQLRDNELKHIHSDIIEVKKAVKDVDTKMTRHLEWHLDGK